MDSEHNVSVEVSSQSLLYLVLFEGPIDQQGGLFIHPLYDCMGHSIVRLGAGLSRLNTVFIIHILLSRPATQGPTLKGIVYPKIGHHLLILMFFQAQKTFVPLLNTNEDILSLFLSIH